MDEPCIGKLIKENCSVGQFLDNCIYLIADEESSFAKKAVSLMEEYNAKIQEQNMVYFNDYDLEQKILSWGDFVEVLKPVSLVRIISHRLEIASLKYDRIV